MDLSALRQQVMFQIGGDAEDVKDFLPHLNDYINEAYDRLVMAAHGRHLCPEDERFQPLSHELSQPTLPAWTHRAIADWATWLVCRNGSAQRQICGSLSKVHAARNIYIHILIIHAYADALFKHRQQEGQAALVYA